MDPLTIAATASAVGTASATALMVVSSRRGHDTQPDTPPEPVDRWWDNLPR